LAHLSELSWDRNRSPEEIYHVGDEVDAFVMKVDPDTKKIALSLRRAKPERWEEIADNYHQGQMVVGRTTKLVTFGAFARIEGPVEGLIHVSELVERRITHPKEVVREGDILPLRIVRIERDRHRLGLSLKAARDQAEAEGWEFDNDGRVSYVPPDVVASVEARLGGPPPEAAEPEYSDAQEQSEAPPAGEPVTPEPQEAPVAAKHEAAEASAEAQPEAESPPESEPSEHEPDENGRMPVERPADSTGAAKDR
jgi:predicted RNA-binding protein with RPS1 domain